MHSPAGRIPPTPTRRWRRWAKHYLAQPLDRRISPATRERIWHAEDFLGLARRGVPGAVIALCLVGFALAIEASLGQPGQDLDARNAALTVLGTVVGFFAVATLAVSVSLSLLQTAADTWPASVLEVFTEDQDREFLLTTIYASFLVSLASLALLASGALHPLVALAQPVVLACVTLMLMVGYVHSRVRLFSSSGLVAEIGRRAKRHLDVLSDEGLDHDVRVAASDRSLAEISRITTITQLLVKEERTTSLFEEIHPGLDLIWRWIESRSNLQEEEGDSLDGETPDWDARFAISPLLAKLRSAELHLTGMDQDYGIWFGRLLPRLSNSLLIEMSYAHLWSTPGVDDLKDLREVEPGVREALRQLGRLMAKVASRASEMDDVMKSKAARIEVEVASMATDLAGLLTSPSEREAVILKAFTPALLKRPSCERLRALLATA
jgi:hypothetical protein